MEQEATINLYEKNGSEIMATTDGESSVAIKRFESYEIMGKYPYFELDLYAASFESFYGAFDFQLEFLSDVINYKVKVCSINKKIDLSNSIMTIIGKFAPLELCLNTNTVFLGNTTKDAINTLGFEQKLNLSQNVSARFVQVNETPVNALLKICDCESDFPYWAVGITDIILTKKTEQKEFITLDSVKSIYENASPNVQVKNGNYDDCFYSTNINTRSSLGNNENYLAIENAVKNDYLRKFYKPYYIMVGTYSNFYPYTLGSVCNNKLNVFKTIDFWVVTSIVLSFNGGKFSTSIEYSSWKE